MRDYRVQWLPEMPNVEIFRESLLGVEDVLTVEVDHVAFATGAKWIKERFNEEVYLPVATGEATARLDAG